MLEYYEVSPLPEVCIGCSAPDCYECDYALDRFHLTPESEIELQRLKSEYKEKRKNKRRT